MAKTVKQNRRKTLRRVKKGLAKASKRVVKHMNQLSMKGRKIVNRAKKMKLWGGMKYITKEDRGDLIKIWDTFCKNRVDEPGKFDTLKKPVDTAVKKYALFVIDMQNDFIDRPYERVYNGSTPQPDELNFVDNLTKNGNFDVAQGATMIIPLLEKLEKAINDINCKYIIFSRDYHPVGHASFFYMNKDINMSNETYKGLPSGRFPAHCVQQHNGSRLIEEIEKFITKYKNSLKIKVIFKGIHQTVDSFTAVPMDKIDHIASNYQAKSETLCKPCADPTQRCCSSMTGGFYLPGKNAEDAMNYMDRMYHSNAHQVTYDNKLFIDLNSVSKIEVCGLAGDYCVRDTIVALAKKYNKKEIVLLNYLTRYAFLPLFTIKNIPEHKAEYLTEFTPTNFPANVNIPNGELDMYKNTGDENNSNRADKDIKYYVFDCPLRGSPRLMNPDELKSLGQEDFIFFPGAEDKSKTLPLTRKHFITGHTEILSDYENTNKNINANIRIQWMPTPPTVDDQPSIDVAKTTEYDEAAVP
jgi:nicotinamidase-related amidase